MAKASINRRTARIIVRVSAGERRVLSEAARRQGSTVSALVRSTVAERGSPIA